MLNPFPELLNYALLSSFLVRLALGLFFFYRGFSLVKKVYAKSALPPIGETNTSVSPTNDILGVPQKESRLGIHVFGWASIFGSISVLLGFYTQIGVLVLGVLSIYNALKNKQERGLYFVLFALSLSLLFSGAGILAFDLPL